MDWYQCQVIEHTLPSFGTIKKGLGSQLCGYTQSINHLSLLKDRPDICPHAAVIFSPERVPYPPSCLQAGHRFHQHHRWNLASGVH